VSEGVPASAWVPRTKFVRPLPSKDAVIDPALLDRVERSLAEVPFTLIAAEAGAGKTTLAAAAADRVAMPVAWISLDEHDDDPQTFLQLLVIALHAVVPGGCPATAELMASELPASVDPIRMVGVMINDLLDAGRTPTVLVLDDLHLLKASGVTAALDYLLARLPDNARLLATARADPPLALARLRARHRLTEIGAEDLRLSLDQAEVLLNQNLGLGLAPDEVERVVRAAGGWVTGIRLLAQTAGLGAGALPPLRGAENLEAVEAYLAAEVLDHEPEDVRRFLLDSSVLDELDPAVTAALTGREDTEGMLADLRRRHALLVLPVDPATSTYRYHDLFRSFLRRRLRQRSPVRVTQLHVAAAAATRMPAQRVEHLLAAEVWDEAADTLEQLAQGVFPQPSEARRLASWISRLPASTLARRPRLGLVLGLAAVQRGEMARAAQVLEPVLAAVDDADHYPAKWLAARSLHLATNDHARFAPLLGQLEVDPRFAELPPAAQVDHHVSTAYGCLFGARWDEVARRVGVALDLTATTADQSAVEVLAQHVSPLLAGADDALNRIGAYATWTDRRFRDGPALVRLGIYHQRAFVALLRSRFDDAIAAACAAGDLPERLGGLPYLRATFDWVEAGAAFAMGDRPAAEAQLRSALDDPDATDLDRELHVLRYALLARVLRHGGHIADLADIAARVDVAGAAARYSDFARLAALSVRAQQAWSVGDLQGAAETLRQAVPLDERVRIIPFVGNAVLDLALVLDADGDREHALTVLLEVASRASRWRAPGVLAGAGQEAIPLFRAAAERDVGGEVVREALQTLTRTVRLSPVPVPGSAEVLSAREVEVLRLLSAGASNQAIAERLIISQNTVKTHVRSVMTKLRARSRGEAVAAARRSHVL
jgi:LuxR family transcriptional regulator, maltose regulon positive regulatory protein